MKIAILGYGKMGKTIEQLALADNQEVVLKIGKRNTQELNLKNLQKADVAIEFSRPEHAFDNITACFEAGIPVISGTTGWLENMEKAKELCQEKNGAFFYASNFSIGVYLFSVINQQMASMMNVQEQYQVKMEEIHHTQKLDAPSGTAITLAKGILDNLDRKSDWVLGSHFDENQIPIEAKRIDKVPGTHSIEWTSAIDTIRIEHIAHSREGFAKGALAAASWIIGKKGHFGMSDLLGI